MGSGEGLQSVGLPFPNAKCSAGQKMTPREGSAAHGWFWPRGERRPDVRRRLAREPPLVPDRAELHTQRGWHWVLSASPLRSHGSPGTPWLPWPPGGTQLQLRQVCPSFQQTFPASSAPQGRALAKDQKACALDDGSGLLLLGRVAVMQNLCA